MIAALLSLLGSSAVGSLLGGVFALLNKRHDLELRKLEMTQEVAKWGHDLALRDKDLEYAKVEAAGRKDVAVVESDALVDAARMKAIAESHAAERLDAGAIKAAGKLGFLLVLADAGNRLIRPIATVILTSCALYINWLVIGFLTVGWVDFSSAQKLDAGMQAFAWVTGQASAALGYWFVSRGSAK
jgi:hypothetical protein